MSTERPHVPGADDRSQVVGPVGTRLALVGAVLYLLEWVAIIAASPPGPLGPGSTTREILAAYDGAAGAAAFSMAWFAVCLLGRVLFVTALKSSLTGGPGVAPLMDLAVAAMAVGVVLEVASYGVAAGAAQLTADLARPGVVVGLDHTGYWLNVMLFGPTGVAMVSAGLAMLRSRAFASWLCWLPLLAGTAAIVGCILTAVSADSDGAGVGAGVTSIAAVGMWVWMLVTGVKLWRSAGR